MDWLRKWTTAGGGESVCTAGELRQPLVSAHARHHIGSGASGWRCKNLVTILRDRGAARSGPCRKSAVGEACWRDAGSVRQLSDDERVECLSPLVRSESALFYDRAAEAPGAAARIRFREDRTCCQRDGRTRVHAPLRLPSGFGSTEHNPQSIPLLSHLEHSGSLQPLAADFPLYHFCLCQYNAITVSERSGF